MDCFITLEMHIIKGNTAEVIKELTKSSSYDAELGNVCLVQEPSKRSILHIAAGAGQAKIISCILEKERKLLYLQNDNGDLPIHVALKAGQKDAVLKLVEEEEQYKGEGPNNQLEMPNKEGNTALHIALDGQFDEELASYLFNKFPRTFYETNNDGISPLYLAIKSRYFNLAQHMVEHPVSNKRCVVDALKNAYSVVHAAIMAESQEVLKALMDEYPQLKHSFYDKKYSILSNAARIGFVDGVKYLLTKHPELACQQNKDEDGTYPFYQACSGGNLQVVKLFFKHFSTMKCSLNQQNQNILHIAAMNGKNDIVKFVLRQPDSKTEGLINMKDDKGNTPLHLAAMGNHPKVVYTLTGDKRVKKHLQNKCGLTALDLVEISDYGPSFEKRLTWTALLYANVPRSKEVVTRNITTQLEEVPTRNTTTLSEEVATSNTTTKSTTSTDEIFKERVNTLLLVCTLVATVTFAATFTMPGGYNQSQQQEGMAPLPGGYETSQQQEGMATLAHRHAFQVFVISNTIAMYSSMFSAITLIWAQLNDINLSLKSFKYAMPSLACALIMMPVAFMTGSYVVLHSVCNWLAITVLILGGGFSVFALAFFIPLCIPVFRMKSKFMRYLYRILFRMMLFGCSQS